MADWIDWRYVFWLFLSVSVTTCLLGWRFGLCSFLWLAATSVRIHSNSHS